jgi:exosortase
VETSNITERRSERPTLFHEFLQEFPSAWKAIPHKGLFTALFVIWTVFFEFFGSSIFGYFNSLYLFMSYSYMGPDDSHGFILPLVVLALFWWKRNQLKECETRLWLPGTGFFLLAILIHVVGYVIQQPRISMISLFFGWYALIGMVWGPSVFRASFFPMILFVFGIPLGTIAEMITVPLRLVATKITTILAGDILGMNIVQRGTQIIDLSGSFQFEVAAACSGLRSLTAVLALCTIYSFMNFNSSWRRVLLVGAGFPLAIVGNVLRLLTLIMVSEAFGHARGEAFHDSTFFSLLPYIPALLGIMALGHFLREKKNDPKPPKEPPSSNFAGVEQPA